MRILVTGGSGRIGRHVVSDLVQAGHQVTSVDVVHRSFPDTRTMMVDLTEAGQVYQALTYSEAEAVIHLGAWANYYAIPHTCMYGDNVRGTFNLFQACAELGVRRVISASSAQVYGVRKVAPVYVPIDEDHPLRPVDAYALSKLAGEQATDYFLSRWGLEVISFRFMGVRVPSELDAEIEQVASNPEWRIHLLWTRMDARDAALACRLAVEVKDIEPGPYNITGQCVVLEEDSKDLVRRYFGNQTEIRDGLTGRLSPLTCTRAENAIGYQPQYAWSVSDRYPTG
jgi:nucleoside-diphosphate-sugar epimerase